MSSVAAEWLHDHVEVHGVSGGEFLIECPWCSKVKLYANPKRLVFVCFRCRERGRLSKLVAHVLGVTQGRAEDLIKSRTHVDEDDLRAQLRQLETGSSSKSEPVNHPLPDEFVPCYNGVEWSVPVYLDDRELDNASLIRNGVGYALEGRYRERVIIPVIHGEHRTFLARLMGRPSVFAWTSKDTGKRVVPVKYLAPRGANLSDVVYGAARIEPGANLLGVEGCFDVMRLTSLGFDAVGFFGKRITRRQAAIIRSLRPRSLTVLFDDDALAYAYLDALQLVGTLPEVYVGQLPKGEDPDSLGLHGGAPAVERVLTSRRRAGNPLDSLAAALERL